MLVGILVAHRWSYDLLQPGAIPMQFAKVTRASIALLMIAGSTAQAQVSFGTSGGFVSITLGSNINFTATGGPDFFTRFIFEDAYSSAPGSQYGNPQSNTMGLLVNGNPMVGAGAGSTWGPLSFNLGMWDMNDFGISFTNASGYGAGDIITLTAGTAVTSVPGAFLPDLDPSSVTMTGNSGNALSHTVDLNAVVATPEPASMLLTATGLAVFAGFARRRRVA